MAGSLRDPVVHHLPEVTSPAGQDQGRTPEGSLADLLDRWTGPALGLARRIVVDDRIAEDVVQEAFLACWRSPAAFENARGSFGSWFLSLVHHEALVLAYWGGFTQREIAARTGAPLGTVKTRMLAGMRRLHQVLDGGVLTSAV